MDYEKLWNDLKADMLVRADLERTTNETHEYLLYASQILKKMAHAEVEEYYQKDEKQKMIDTKMLEVIFPPIIKKEGV